MKKRVSQTYEEAVDISSPPPPFSQPTTILTYTQQRERKKEREKSQPKHQLVVFSLLVSFPSLPHLPPPPPVIAERLLLSTMSKPHSLNGSESEFEFVETPKAPTPTYEQPVDCGVKTTNVCLVSKSGIPSTYYHSLSCAASVLFCLVFCFF